MNLRKKILTTCALFSLSVSFSSNATLINTWDYLVDTAFTSYAPAGVSASLNNTYWANPTKLSWGTPVGTEQSSIQITSGTNGNVTGTLGLGDLGLTSTLTHNNFVIRGGSTSLASAVLNTRLLLDPNPTDSNYDIALPELSFNINFKETSNGGTCSVPSPVPCNDIFVIDPGPAFNPISNSFNQQFTYSIYTYNVELIVDGLGVLPTAGCLQATGSSDPCIGLTTVERASNHFDVNMRITQVPEPSSILLISLALLGLLSGMRNKHI